jgi:hypothetical protein
VEGCGQVTVLLLAATFRGWRGRTGFLARSCAVPATDFAPAGTAPRANGELLKTGKTALPCTSKIQKIVQENNSFRFHAGFGPNPFHRHPSDSNQGIAKDERFAPGASLRPAAARHWASTFPRV